MPRRLCASRLTHRAGALSIPSMMNQGSNNKRSHHRLNAAVVIALLFARALGWLMHGRARSPSCGHRPQLPGCARPCSATRWICVSVARAAPAAGWPSRRRCARRVNRKRRAADSTLRWFSIEVRLSANPPTCSSIRSSLRFNEDPEWKRRAKILARDGLPFMRMPEGANHELLVGVTPHGQLGVSLRDTTGE